MGESTQPAAIVLAELVRKLVHDLELGFSPEAGSLAEIRHAVDDVERSSAA